MSRVHDETKLPKWAQRELATARANWRDAHETIMRNDPFQLEYYRKNVQCVNAFADYLGELVWGDGSERERLRREMGKS